ncbi:MAG: hypothetical protein KJO69_10950, partial [Gammaproteobacteria bacterium]|nr:hypothetical protein [Gammaproteobacteria bacterium]
SSDVQTSIETTDFVGSTTPVTSAVTSFTISGLDLNDGEEYIFDYWLNNTAGSTALYYIGVNGEDGTTGYQTQLSEFTNTTVTASKTTTGLIGFANTTRNATGFGRITMSGNSGVFVASDLHTNLGASPEHAMYRVWRDSTLSGSITSVKITSSVTNGIGVDSYFRIKRKVGAS